MTVKLMDAPGSKKLRSQRELDELFHKVTRAAKEKRSADAKHMVEVYNKVVADGRFVKEFATDPGGAAEGLGLILSESQVTRIKEAHRISQRAASEEPYPSPTQSTTELVAVAIIVLVLAEVPNQEVVIDTAGLMKL